jgi:ribosomal protein S21
MLRGNMNEKQLAKLIKKNAAKAAKLAKAREGRAYDPTVPPPRDNDTDVEREQFFKEMKRREF